MWALIVTGIHYSFQSFANVKQGRSIESMDDLFQIPLWMMWKHAYPKSDEEKVRHDVVDSGATKLGVEHHEMVIEGKDADSRA